ncbi:MAG TPA: Ku protein [Candidatus Rhabdochlamydia sp.]|jgi:DNA end-binding protein Ku|nr:Ku protein [Candidatus Rhabdochlamydia sp.]
MRSIWKGALSFGLVNIPVYMYTASLEKEISFVLLHKKDFSKVRYVRVCELENKEIPWQEIVKGYEYKKGDFVILQDVDFEKANLKKTKTIEIVHFVKEDEVDSIYYAKPYYLEPAKNAEKAYGLLREALKKSQKVGLAKYVLRNREHLAVVKVYENMIILNQLRYQNEILRAQDLTIPSAGKINPKEMNIAIALIDHLTTSFKPKDYKDTFTEEIKQIIKQKTKGRPIHPKTQEPKVSKVHDIMTLLQNSLEKEKRPKKRKLS